MLIFFSLCVSDIPHFRELNVENAKKMLVDTLKWRIEFKVDDVTKEEFPKDIFENLGHIYGTDKGGRSVTYVGIILHVFLFYVWIVLVLFWTTITCAHGLDVCGVCDTSVIERNTKNESFLHSEKGVY